MTFNFANYLSAKKSVDDRALNRGVLQSLVQHLEPIQAQDPLHVLEIGAGIGTMLERLLEWKILGNTAYTAIDLQPENIAEAARRLPSWAANLGFRIQQKAAGIFILQRPNQRLSIMLQAIDAFDFVNRNVGLQKWDLIIAHAFWDIVDIPTMLPDLLSLLRSDGFYYFTINFDGQTIFLPEIDPSQDREIIELYHRHMDEKTVGGHYVGGSQTGRELFEQQQLAGGQIVDAGSSDWVVFPSTDGYHEDEAYFLHCIVDTIQTALQDQAPFDIQPWIEQRHMQIDQNELIFITHQLDFLGKKT
jgi:SAM-dependent methyltransferase